MKKFVLLFLVALVGCSSQPTRPLSYGQSQLPKEQIKLYEEPEVVFKDEHTPGSCRSPFR